MDNIELKDTVTPEIAADTAATVAAEVKDVVAATPKEPALVIIVRGQSAEPIGMTYADFNRKEKRLLEILDPNGSGTRTIYTLAELISATGWGKRYGQAKGNSRVRNNLRRLVREKFVEHPEGLRDGRYRVTRRGRNAINKALGQVKAAPVAAPEQMDLMFAAVGDLLPTA